MTADGVDNDCDGFEECYEDADDDTHTSGSTVLSANLVCTDSGEEATPSGSEDCNDGSASIYPGAPEVTADGIDQDCDNGDQCYEDFDDDTYTTGGTVSSLHLSCADTGEASTESGTADCDDTDAAVNPGATEVTADGIDNDCDGFEQCYEDFDDDTYTTGSTVSSANLSCADSGEASTESGTVDCDDTAGSVYPGASESDNLVDDDCDDAVDEDFASSKVLFLTEFMPEAGAGADATYEWFEVFNGTGAEIYLDGLYVEGGGAGAFYVSPEAWSMPDGSYFTFCATAAAANGSCDYVYRDATNQPAASALGATYHANWALTDGGTTLTLTLGAVVMDAVTYEDGTSGWPSNTAGVTHLLQISSHGASGATDNDTGANWCEHDSSATYDYIGDATEFGSPQAEGACP